MSKPPSPHVPGPLAEHAEGFAVFLDARGYVPRGVERYLKRLAHLSRTLASERRDLAAVTSEEVALFEAGEPSVWTEPRPRPFRVVAEYLAAAGAISPAAVARVRPTSCSPPTGAGSSSSARSSSSR